MGIAVAAVAFAGAWVMVWLGPLSYLAAAGFLGITLWLWWISKIAAVISFFASPWVVFSGVAAVSYFNGTATLKYMGLPGDSSTNLDRACRIRQVTGGCVVTGNEWIRIHPNNLTVRALSAMFGPMPGAVRGPYPKEADLFSAWPDASPQSLDDIAAGRVLLADRSIQLPEEVLPESFLSGNMNDPRLMAFFARDHPRSVNLTIEAKDYGEGSFAIRVDDPEKNGVAVFLFGGEQPQFMARFYEARP